MRNFIKRFIYEIAAVSVLVLGIGGFTFAAVTVLFVPQGGTGVGSFPVDSLVISGTTQTGALRGTSTPTIGGLFATTTTATSTFSGGLKADRGIQFDDLVSCNTIDTDANGFLFCGTDTGGAAADPNVVLAVIGGTTYLRASTTANAWYFNQGFVSNASSTLFGLTNIGVATSTNFLSTGSSTIASVLNVSGTLNANSGITALGTISLPAGEIGNAELANSTISGVALGGTLANLTATDGTLTFSGTYTGALARTIGLNLGNSNIWTASTTFNSLLSISGGTGGVRYVQFGSPLNASSTATSTFAGGLNIASIGGLTSASGLTVTGGSLLQTNTATNTFSGGLSVGGGGLSSSAGLVLTGGSILQTNNASSTLAGGINITNGCFSINGTCVGGGAGGGFTIAGRSLTAPDSSTVDADAELYTKTISFNIASSTLGTSTQVAAYQFPVNGTITEVNCSVNTGAANIQIDRRSSGAPQTAGTNLLLVALQCDSDTASTTTFASSGTLTAGGNLNVQITDAQPSSTRPTLLMIHIKWTAND